MAVFVSYLHGTAAARPSADTVMTTELYIFRPESSWLMIILSDFIERNSEWPFMDNMYAGDAAVVYYVDISSFNVDQWMWLYPRDFVY